jgi:hypothetical protein
MTDYQRTVGKAVSESHDCEAVHATSVPVTEMFKGQVAW